MAVGAAGAAPRAIDRVRTGPAFGALAYATMLAVGLSVNAARRGTAGWSHVFDLSGHGSFEASREYLPALKWLDSGVGHYVRHYPDILPYLPTHTKGNPPGPLVAMHLLSITSAGRLTAVCVLVGALVAPLTYLLGRELGDERRGRQAAALVALSPVGGAVRRHLGRLRLRGVRGRRRVPARSPALRRSSRPAALWPASPRSSPGCCWRSRCGRAVTVLRRDGLRAGVLPCRGGAAGLACSRSRSPSCWGYDPVSILRTPDRIYGGGAAAHRPYAFWVFGSPAAWLTMLGLPVAWLALRALTRGEPAAVGLAAVVAISALAGFTKAETERIWLPYVPLACVAAAAMPIRRLRLILGVLALQAVVIEVLFGTVW